MNPLVHQIPFYRWVETTVLGMEILLKSVQLSSFDAKRDTLRTEARLLLAKGMAFGLEHYQIVNVCLWTVSNYLTCNYHKALHFSTLLTDVGFWMFTDVDCLYPEPIDNGEVVLLSNTTYYASVAEYVCKDNFEPVGNAKRACLENGSWEGRPPKCQGEKGNTLKSTSNS